MSNPFANSIGELERKRDEYQKARDAEIEFGNFDEAASMGITQDDFEAAINVLEAAGNVDKVSSMERLETFRERYQDSHREGINLCFCRACEPHYHALLDILSALPDKD